MHPAVREQWDNDHESKLTVRTNNVTATFLQVGFSSRTEALAKAAFFGKKKKKKKSQVGVHYKLGSISSYKLPNLNEIYHFFIGMVPH